MIKKSHLPAIGFLALLAAVSSAPAGVVLLNENFESSTAGDSVVLPWTWSVETFADNAGAPGGYTGGFYPGDSASAGIQVIVDGQSGAQGANALKIYGDYGYAPNFDNNQWVRTSVYQNKTLTPADRADGSLMFTFDYAAFVGEGGIDSTTIAYAYFQILSPGFNETWARQEWAITSADTTFQSGQLWYDVSDPGLDGAQLQWGFATLTQNFSDSAILVDNLQVIPEPSGVILGGLSVALLALRRRRP